MVHDRVGVTSGGWSPIKSVRTTVDLGETMSIFEPIPRESRLDEDTHELDAAPPDDEAAYSGASLDPRSIAIAGLVVAGIVVIGLVASNAARPDPQQERPSVAARVDPGAAAVEQAEAEQSEPTADPSASSDESDEASEDSPTWRETEDSGDDSWSGDSKRDKPGKGHGRGRG
jgi:hypothetical protein